ncbi:MAG: GNAT family N-acetyltransferase [Gemmatimonadales bacterium]
MSTEIVEARSEQDRQAVYALRYAIYVEEMQRPQPHADHELRMLREPEDETAHLLLARNRTGEVVGTARVHLQEAIPSDLAEMYQMHVLEHFHTSQTSTVTKIMVDPAYRRSPLAFRLSQACYDIGIAAGVSFNCIDCNVHLKSYFTQLGFRQISADFQHPLYGAVTPLVLALRDYDYLQRIGSPFRLPATRDPHPSVPFFHRLLSERHLHAEQTS